MKRAIKRTYRNFIFNLSASNSFLIRGFYKYLYAPKPKSLEAFLDNYSKSKQEVIAIQVGANDGITHDPIHKFVKRDRWRAVLLEPLPDVYKSRLSKLYAKDEKVDTINAALGKKDGKQSIFRIGFSNARWATGLTSFRREVLENAFRSGHVSHRAKKEGIAVPIEDEKRIIEEQIEVLSVDTLLSKFQIDNFNILQIDTEGFDFEIIKLFDLEKITPEVIVYENMHFSQEDKASCKAHLRQYGYEVKDYGGNTLACLPALMKYH